MSLKDTFIEIFSPVEHEAEAVAKSLAHIIEKEITMLLPQPFSDVLARIEAFFASHVDQSAALQSQLDDATAANTTKDAQIADLTQKLSDATSQIGDMEQALLDSANKIGA